MDGASTSDGATGATPSATFVARTALGIEDLSKGAHDVDLSLTQMSAGPCGGAFSHTIFDDTVMTVGRFTGDLRMRGTMTPQAVTLSLVLEQTRSLVEWGQDVRGGDLLVFPMRAEEEARHQGTTRYVGLKLPLDTLLRHAAPFEDLADDRNWRGAVRLRPEAGLGLAQEIRRRLEFLNRMGPQMGAQALTNLRDEVLVGFLAAADLAAREAPRRQGWINGARIVRQVEDYLDQSQGGAVSTPALCEALALSRRTLTRAFEETLGVGPKTYLRLRALSSARRALLAGRDGGVSVTQVALEHGFWELGRFAGSYRTLFGESPSQTLRGVGRGGGAPEPRLSSGL